MFDHAVDMAAQGMSAEFFMLRTYSAKSSRQAKPKALAGFQAGGVALPLKCEVCAMRF
ncbi:hypothetical protein SAMN06265795_10344 [Noviherbaspirillum humi]|uniref:Uncharacterized protein n=1 Tax=Noviherbaspirillum humi TaxID=1688639 RepID=A0A239EVX9_9BURK|nr:hypothetical protein [Noviherbaspirillum humi]SNS48785.1 hypothetical protein SAMN06265795_10344 [Noviherbaspirillum humi]